MKVVKKIGLAICMLSLLVLLVVSTYGLGDGIVQITPYWLIAFVIGVVLWVIVGVLMFIFAVGIVSIKERLGGQE